MLTRKHENKQLRPSIEFAWNMTGAEKRQEIKSLPTDFFFLKNLWANFFIQKTWKRPGFSN